MDIKEGAMEMCLMPEVCYEDLMRLNDADLRLMEW